jgi:hypothetical protein
VTCPASPKYSAAEFAVIMDFLEQTSAALDAEIQAFKESAKKAPFANLSR